MLLKSVSVSTNQFSNIVRNREIFLEDISNASSWVQGHRSQTCMPILHSFWPLFHWLHFSLKNVCYYSFFVCRQLFLMHSMVAIYRVTYVLDERYWYLAFTLLGIITETVIVLIYRRGREWNWWVISRFKQTDNSKTISIDPVQIFNVGVFPKKL